MAAPSRFTGTVDGQVTTSRSEAGSFTIVNPLTFTLTIVVPNLPEPIPPLATTCDSNATVILHIGPEIEMFPVPTTPTTSGTTSTTDQVEGTEVGIPRFTG